MAAIVLGASYPSLIHAFQILKVADGELRSFIYIRVMAEVKLVQVPKPTQNRTPTSSQDSVVSHRRALSNTSSTLGVSPEQSHRRTFSGAGPGFKRVQASSPTLDQEQLISDRRRTRNFDMTPDSLSPPDSPGPVRYTGTRGFLGTLDAAILYFETVQVTSYIPPSAAGHDVTNLRHELEAVKTKADRLEQQASALATENANHVKQREYYERNIGALNTQIIDLQVALEECNAQLHRYTNREHIGVRYGKSENGKADASSLELSDLILDGAEDQGLVRALTEAPSDFVRSPAFPVPKSHWSGLTTRPGKSTHPPIRFT